MPSHWLRQPTSSSGSGAATLVVAACIAENIVADSFEERVLEPCSLDLTSTRPFSKMETCIHWPAVGSTVNGRAKVILFRPTGASGSLAKAAHVAAWHGSWIGVSLSSGWRPPRRAELPGSVWWTDWPPAWEMSAQRGSEVPNNQ